MPVTRSRMGRFERRVLLAIAAVAVVPLVAVLVLGRIVLAEAYRVGVNPRVGAELDSGLERHRELLVSMRGDVDHSADAVAYDHRLVRLLESGDLEGVGQRLSLGLEAYPALVRLSVVLPNGQRVERGRRIEADARQLELTREVETSAGVAEVAIVAAAPRRLFEEYEQAGELTETYEQLQASTDYVATTYFAAFVALVVAVVGVSLTFGLVAGRRVTRRVMDIAAATRRVGRGELGVEIAVQGNDEVSELMRSFNTMVRDIRASRDRIEYLQRVGAWQEMAKRLAHEIKNPLTPIQLAVQEIHKGYRGDDPKYRRTLDDARAIVEEEVATLRRLVKEFSEFARLPTPELELADLSEFAETSLRGVDSSALLEGAPKNPVELRLELGGSVAARIDAQMLRRCLDNLVRNAVQAVAAAGSSGDVVVATLADAEHAILEVRDSGPGVPESNRERVFDPYFTTKSTGTGLGLAIVKKVVLEHGGTISCIRAREGGACFRIELPVAVGAST
jgi:two-component system, NtrC family, nitrogen regulation sensor histidine kinase NtrY